DKVITPLETIFPNRSKLINWLWRPAVPAKYTDLFHHNTGLLFPLHDKANVLTIHDLILYHDPLYAPEATEGFRDAFDNACHMDAILTYSTHTKNDVRECLGVPAERIHVTPLAAHRQYRPLTDRTHIHSVLAKYDLAGPYVLYLGALERRK